MNKKQMAILLIGIAGMLYVAWQCFNFPLTDSSEVETTRRRLFGFFEIIIAFLTVYLFYRNRNKNQKTSNKNE